LFVIPEKSATISSGGSAAVSVGLACVALAEGLYIPADASIHPALTEGEARAICPGNTTLFHPTLGWSTFSDDEMLRVWDLLELREERFEQWNGGGGGEPQLPMLQGIVLAEPPTADEVFGDAAETIGKEPADDLPPTPEEPKQGPLSNSGRGFKKFIA